MQLEGFPSTTADLKSLMFARPASDTNRKTNVLQEFAQPANKQQVKDILAV